MTHSVILSKRFKINDTNRKMYMHACYPQGKNKTIPGTESDDKYFVWMPKLYTSNSRWKNRIGDDRNMIYEIAGPTCHTNWMDEDKYVLNGIRLVFVKSNIVEPYEFIGAYVNDKMEYLKHSYRCIATRVRLIGEHVT